MADDMRQELLGRIAARRASIDRYLGDVRPRSGRLNTVSIISSAIAGIFVAGPAVGREKFTAGVANALSLETGSDVWGPLCLLALIANVVASITSRLHMSQDLSARVSAAEVCDAELEGLQVLLQFDRLSTDDAVDLYQRCVARIPFVD